MNLFSSHPASLHLVSSDRSPRRRRIGTVMLAALLSIGVADGAMARDKTRNTLIGAGIGAAGGALLSNGDVWGTLGGAAAGGLIGNVLTNDHHHHGDHGRDSRHGHDRRGHDRHGYPPHH
jgi:hypothetical protein